MKGIFESVLRGVGMIVGIIGAILGLLFTFINFGVRAFASGIGSAHTPTGIAMSILAFIGALLALPFPTVSAVLMLIAGIVLVVIQGWLGVLPLIVLAIAAIMVFLDRNRQVSAAR